MEKGHFSARIDHVDNKGRTFTCESQGMLLKDDKGNVLCLAYSARKVLRSAGETDRRHIELLDDERMSGRIPEPLIAADRELQCTFWNDAAENVFRRAANDVMGRSVLEILSITEESESGQHFHKALADGLSREFILEREFSGRTLSLAISVHPSPNGLVVLARDVTMVKKAEQAFAQSEMHLRAAFNNTEVAIIVFDMNSRFIDFNETWCHMLGYSRSELLGRSPADLTYPGDRYVSPSNVHEELKKGNDRIRVEKRYVRKDGSVLWGDLILAPILGSDGEAESVIGIVEDITNRKVAEEVYRKAIENSDGVPYEFSREKGEFVFVGEGLEKILGISAEELTREKLRELILFRMVYDDVGKVSDEETYVGSFDAGNVERYRADLKIRTPDGRIRWVHDCSVHIRDAKTGEILGSTGILQDITDRKLADKTLRESEEKLRNVFALSPEALVVVNFDANIADCNEAALRLYGFSREEFVGKNLFEIVPARFREEAKETFRVLIENGTISDNERAFLRKDGTEFQSEVKARLLTNDEGKTVGILAIVRDVTHDKLQQDLLKESEERFRMLFDNATSGAVVLDPDTKNILQANNEFCSMLGYARDEMLQLKLSDVHAEKDLPEVIRDLDRFISGEETLFRENPMKRKDGGIVYVDTRAFWLTLNGREYICANFTDVTEAKITTELLLSSYAFLEEAKPDDSLSLWLSGFAAAVKETTNCECVGIRLIDEEGNIPYVVVEGFPEGFAHREGHDSLQTAPCKCGDVLRGAVSPDHEHCTTGGSFCCNDMSHYSDEIDHAESLRMRAACKKHGFETLAFIPIRSANGVLGLIHLADSRKNMLPLERVETLERIGAQVAMAIENVKAQLALRKTWDRYHEAEKMEAVGRLAEGVAHGFNNALTSIIGHSELMRSWLESDQPQRENVDEILKAAEAAMALLRQLETFTGRQTEPPVSLNINRLLSDNVGIIESVLGEQIGLELACEPNLHFVEMPALDVHQIFLNLALKARSDMPRGGRVTISTKNVYLGRDFAQEHIGVPPGNYVMISLADTCTSSKNVDRSKMFEPFYQTGTTDLKKGLGLATVYGIVKRCGGGFDVRDRPGSGMSLTIYLPEAKEATQTLPEPVLVGGRRPTTKINVLVVDDDRNVRNILARMLEHKGYHVSKASSAENAIEITESHEEGFDFLVTDVVMQEMNGIELARELGMSYQRNEVLFISGYPPSMLHEEFGMDSEAPYLKKPFAMEIFLSLVGELVEKQQKGGKRWFRGGTSRRSSRDA